MPTYRLDLEYEGTRYRGWQEQQNARTVAGELRGALARTCGAVGELVGSGRTDAGVHALDQVAHLRLARAVDPAQLVRTVNDALPADIHVLAAVRAPESFHARHAALSRTYLYQVARRRSALAKRFVWWVKRPLDPDRMGAAAALITGRHDFDRFCERPAEQPSTLVVVERTELAVAGSLVLLRVSASHFVWKMVRRLTGALVRVGAGELSTEEFGALLAGHEIAGPRGAVAEWTAPPSGLFLERVAYAGDPPLPPLAPAVPVP
ncbi:MAG: tRNA pseudouridine(38-40) synthase TruA [Acidobacteria bacterium]|nr:tRNA pseudouridine(38-40) synthase TruA [Acidobacteriota bacterium]